MEPSWLPSSRGAASRPLAQQNVVSPGSDSVMRRLGLVIRGHDGLTRTRSHGALSLIRLPLPIVPPPVPRPRPPAPDLYRHTRGVHNKCPTVGGATVPRRKTRGRPIASPAALCVAGAVLACHRLRTVDWFGQGLQRVSAAAGESRALEAPCLERDEAMTSMRPSAAAVRFFFPSTTAAGE